MDLDELFDSGDLDLMEALRARMREHAQADRLWLAGLTDDELAQEIKRRTSGDPLAEGNPAFAIEEGEARWGRLADLLRPTACLVRGRPTRPRDARCRRR
jgi:hypothetical protein